MAARRTNFHHDEVRKRIQTSQLINRLQENALGKTDLTPVQQKSIEILLRKSVPDISAVQLSGDPDGAPIQVNFQTVYETVDKKTGK